MLFRTLWITEFWLKKVDSKSIDWVGCIQFPEWCFWFPWCFFPGMVFSVPGRVCLVPTKVCLVPTVFWVPAWMFWVWCSSDQQDR